MLQEQAEQEQPHLLQDQVSHAAVVAAAVLMTRHPLAQAVQAVVVLVVLQTLLDLMRLPILAAVVAAAVLVVLAQAEETAAQEL
jgi:hypothetical protein